MKKKTLLIKIVEFIRKANIQYRKSPIGDILMLVLIVIMMSFGELVTLLTIFLIILLRGIYYLNILEKLEAMNEETSRKNTDSDENIK